MRAALGCHGTGRVLGSDRVPPLSRQLVDRALATVDLDARDVASEPWPVAPHFGLSKAPTPRQMSSNRGHAHCYRGQAVATSGTRPGEPGDTGASMRRTSIAAETAALIDASVNNPVLVVGSPPPGGRDLDLLANAGEYNAIAASLADAGFLRWRHSWATFDGTSVYAVDLAATTRWRSAGHDSSVLFEDARGNSWLFQPRPPRAGHGAAAGRPRHDPAARPGNREGARPGCRGIEG